MPLRPDLPGPALAYTTDSEWSAGLVDDLPTAWAARMLARWSSEPDRRARNLRLLSTVGAVRRAAVAGLAPDAGDGQIRAEADASARDMTRRLGLVQRIAAGRLADREPDQRERLQMLGQVIEARHWLDARGLGDRWPDGRGVTITGALRRVQCPRWWRRVLRRLHAQACEGTARTIGLVHRHAGCYASDDACRRRRGQVVRNEAALQSVTAVNETGQSYTLAELAAKGAANKQIRRHELMTRIAGFEVIARECSHGASFVTVTCPSRMHAMRSKRTGWGVEPNPVYDGTQPDEAQRWLAGQWAKFRSAADRQGLDVYGFRIAEPQHDGTPHWHALLFHPERVGAGTGRRPSRHEGGSSSELLAALLDRYFLQADSPTEPGAAAHRVTIEAIDWKRGSAAGYVAKYVSKNIDGNNVGRDLFGNDAMESSARVEAWASTWRIRQFQQIGGAPVGIWRELRRLHPEQADTAPAVALMLDAVNVTASADTAGETEAVRQYTAAHGWATYLELQGGARVPRRLLRVRLLQEQTGEIGRYGEPTPARPVGVQHVEQRSEWVPMPMLKAGGFRRQWTGRVEVESERSTWIVVPKARAAETIQRMQSTQPSGAAARPWSPVNNCPRQPADEARMFAPTTTRHRRLGRWHTWSTRNAHHDRDLHRDPRPDRSSQPRIRAGAGPEVD
ncbi:replication endonuclease [Sphaerotilus mobilis]|uniref:Bacteriophage replication gene A protein n=1 Tax=Sphaerotilus mobilis TaxID=47994 RepID=A0A4Q7LQ49_9BURK|nr:replication endonuclease [Sphaerotilus mobilis]RZS56714.1 bacteriophage replication gene A protein [Sphaerotilus mobilis]